MELRVLRYFTAVVDEGSITDAAKALHVTQPTLSRQLAQLEQEMGAPLFTRGRTGVELTDRGSVLNRYARDILELADKAEEEVAMPVSSVTGTVHIGAGETRAFSILATACARVRKRYPGITFDVHDGTSADLKEHFARALRHWAGSERANLERQIVCNHWLPLNAKHLVSAGIGVMLTYGGLIGEEGSSDGLCFRPLSPRVEATHKVLWRKVMPTKPMQAFIDELTLLCE